MMKAAAILGSTFLMICGCDAVRGPEEVRACEAFVKEQLRSPSTYKQAQATVGEPETISHQEFIRQYVGDDPDELTKLLKARVEGHKLSIKHVFVKYDADNAYGTPIRDLSMCDFLLVDGELDGKGSLESRAQSAASRKRLHELTEQINSKDLQQLGRRHGESLSDCCVRY